MTRINVLSFQESPIAGQNYPIEKVLCEDTYLFLDGVKCLAKLKSPKNDKQSDSKTGIKTY